MTSVVADAATRFWGACGVCGAWGALLLDGGVISVGLVPESWTSCFVASLGAGDNELGPVTTSTFKDVSWTSSINVFDGGGGEGVSWGSSSKVFDGGGDMTCWEVWGDPSGVFACIEDGAGDGGSERVMGSSITMSRTASGTAAILRGSSLSLQKRECIKCK